MFVLVLELDLQIPAAQSLKDKRAVVKRLIERARQRFNVAIAEVGGQDLLQRAAIGVAVVSGTQRHATDVMDEVERFVWEQDVVVLSMERRWLE